jgi:endo-alpha-N-acetylgalactosaminidase
MKFRLAANLLLFCAQLALAQDPLTLTDGPLRIAIDPGFPRILSYQTPVGTFVGQAAATNQVELNGKPAQCQVTCKQTSAAVAVYQLTFAAEKLAVELVVTVTPGAAELRVSKVIENGPVKVKSLAFPGNALLTISTAQADAAIAACHATNTNDQFGATFREYLGPIHSAKPGLKDTGNYLFLSAGSLAAGIGSGNFTDVQRTAWQVAEANGVKTCSAQNPVWEFRQFDDEPADLPWVKVFITSDLNGDARADWQDAAIAFRRGMPKPFGHEFVKSTVGENIAMNFASGAQQPFLKILDEIKKIHLATDGLGNQVIIKGFSSEGHDSANTDYAGHWNERAGGLKDFTTLLDRAHAYNARIGIHINASEVYPEAHRYRPEILRRDANGNLQGGWYWLDHAVMIDKVKDVRSGQLFSALDQMRKDLPKLDCVYVDTYWENGWPAAQIARKLNSLGLPMYSEGDCCLDPWIVWGHWRGAKHTIQRFLWFSDRDLFTNDPILRGGRSDDDGFMGWQNRHNFNAFIRSTFANHLPAKFLQHFELLRWVPGETAEFSDGVKVTKAGEAVTVTQRGRTLMSWTGGGEKSKLLVPWPPLKPEKIYVWSDAGGDITCDLPDGFSASHLYQLSDRGRGGETAVSPTGGQVTLKIDPGKPYVLYPTKVAAPPPIHWGEGGPVVNPGFDSYDLTDWEGNGPAVVEADKNGNPRLKFMPGEAGIRHQSLAGLKPGKTYAASVWVQTTGSGNAYLDVACMGQTLSNEANQKNVVHSAPNDARTGSNYQRLRVVFTLPANSTTAVIVLRSNPRDRQFVSEFDDVRVMETQVSPEAAKHFFWEDFENIETGGYGPFTCCPGERTHLSEANPPHTKDTINGRFSLKSRDAGQVLRTLPSSLRFLPNTKYRITCQTIGQGHLAAISQGRTVMDLKFPNLPGNQPAPVTGEFIIGDDPEAFLALFRDGGDAIVIDDLAIDNLGTATAAATAKP